MFAIHPRGFVFRNDADADFAHAVEVVVEGLCRLGRSGGVADLLDVLLQRPGARSAASDDAGKHERRRVAGRAPDAPRGDFGR